MDHNGIPDSMEAYRTSDTTPDLTKLLPKFRIPVYVLGNPSFGFRLCRLCMTQPDHFSYMSFEFARPSCIIQSNKIEPTQRVVISNYDKTVWDWDTVSILADTLFDMDTAQTIGKGLLQPPPEFEDKLISALQPIGHELIETHRKLDQFLQNVVWESHFASGLQFQMSYWDGQAPISLARATEDKNLVIMAAVGVSRSEFLEILASLIPVRREHALVVSKFQEELKTAKAEFHRYRQEKYGF